MVWRRGPRTLDGWGSARPSQVFNGGDPSGPRLADSLESWGGSSAIGHGLNAIFKPRGGHYLQLARIELRAHVLVAAALTACPRIRSSSPGAVVPGWDHRVVDALVWCAQRLSVRLLADPRARRGPLAAVRSAIRSAGQMEQPARSDHEVIGWEVLPGQCRDELRAGVRRVAARQAVG